LPILIGRYKIGINLTVFQKVYLVHNI